MRARVVLRSLRARLTLLAIAVIAVALAGAAIVLVELLQQDLQASIDDSVRTEARAAAATLEQGDAAGAADVGGETDTVVQILSADGRVIAASRSIAGKPALFRLPVGVPSRLHDIGTLPFANTADTYRVAGLAASHGRRIYVALASDDFRNTMHELRVALAAGLPVLLALMALIVWLLVGRALTSVDDLRRQAREIRDPAQRLTAPGTAELDRLAATFNEMLDRVDAAQRRQREFVADAAHELRSPLAGLRAQLEVGAAGLAGGDAEQRVTLLAEVERMNALTDGLLQLARLDDVAARSARRQPVDLDEIVWEELERVRPVLRPAVDASSVSAARVEGDAEALRRVVRNLLDNAARHAASTVAVELSANADHATLVVSDDGPGVPAEERTRIFERFSRLDESRERAAGGFGLGLAIVAETVREHGGEVRVESAPAPLGGARFVVTLPTDASTAGGDGSRAESGAEGQ